MNVVFKINDKTKEKMLKYYSNNQRPVNIPYVTMIAEDNDTVITLYNSNKVMFQGKSADVEANIWKELNKNIESKETFTKDIYNIDSIGSDEVGTGDYFGPICVCSTYVSKKVLKELEELNLKDSKEMNDQTILKLAPIIAKKVDYELIILNNKDYNDQYKNIKNINKIKAILHNKVLFNLYQRHKCTIIIDEFANEKLYYSYLTDVKNIQKGLNFIQKAENKNMAVRCSAILARYTFLKQLDILGKKYNIILHKGSSSEVDKQAKELVEKYSKDILYNIAKLNFANTKKILGDKNENN